MHVNVSGANEWHAYANIYKYWHIYIYIYIYIYWHIYVVLYNVPMCELDLQCHRKC